MAGGRRRSTTPATDKVKNKNKGGRPSGSRNKATIQRDLLAEKGLAAALDEGVTPLEVIIRRMREPESISPAQFEAAVAAAPYVHPKLSAIAHVKPPGGDQARQIDFTRLSNEELAVLRKAFGRVALPGPEIEHEGDAADDE